jgi:hypothetical protein
LPRLKRTGDLNSFHLRVAEVGTMDGIFSLSQQQRKSLIDLQMTFTMKSQFLNAAIFFTATLHAEVIKPTAITSSNPSPAQPAVNLIDSTSAEYATNESGDLTFAEMDLGSTKTLDRCLLVTRAVTDDTITAYTLRISTNATFGDADDQIRTVSTVGANGQGVIATFTPATGRYVRWDVDSVSTDSSGYTGGMEIRFLDTPAGMKSFKPTVIAGATPFDPNFALAFAADDKAGQGSGNEYASAGLGTGTGTGNGASITGTYVDFDFGSPQKIAAFDFFDRIGTSDRTTAFNLHFSNDPTFPNTSATTTINYSPSGWGYSQTLATAVTSRYVRYDVTARTTIPGATNNQGMGEMVFYIQLANVVSTGSSLINWGTTQFTGTTLQTTPVPWLADDFIDIKGTPAGIDLGNATRTVTNTLSLANGFSLQNGTLQIGNGGTAGSLLANTINLTNASSNLRINHSDNHTFKGNVTGSGTFTHAGTGQLTVIGDISANISIPNSGIRLNLTPATSPTTYDKTFSGPGFLIVNGPNRPRLNFTGTFNHGLTELVNAHLNLMSTHNGPIFSTGKISGIGTILGIVQANAFNGRACEISPGDGGFGQIGTLTLSGGLRFNELGVSLEFDLGTPANSDKINVSGEFNTNDRAVQLKIAASTGFGPGIYTLIDFNAVNFPSFTVANFSLIEPPAGYTYTLDVFNKTLRLTVASQNALVLFRQTNGLAADGSQDLTTPANDGISNLQKFAFNMIGSGLGQTSALSASNISTTTAFGIAGLPLIRRNPNGYLEVTYIRHKYSSSGIAYTVQFSNNLTIWSAATSPILGTGTSVSTDFERVTVTDDVNTSKHFGRVNIAVNPE